jgi:hypothetical protein
MMQHIPDFHHGDERRPKTSLNLDGREHRWSNDNDTYGEQSKIFNDKYYATDYGQFVNYYDDLEEIESKR